MEYVDRDVTGKLVLKDNFCSTVQNIKGDSNPNDKYVLSERTL